MGKLNQLVLLSLLSAIGVSHSQTTLRQAAQRSGIYYGCAVGGAFWGPDSAAYRTLIKQQANIIVAENEMKFVATEPSRNNFNWKEADDLVNFAEANGMKIRGHCLVWHGSIPSWLTAGNFSRTELLSIMKNHIDSVVGRYKGRIFGWDVVNEAISDDNSSAIFRNTLFSTTIGSDYIDSAFVYAHRADPAAVLYYNEYGNEDLSAKTTKLYNLLVGFKQRNIPVHGVGMQFHWEGGQYDGFSPTVDQNFKKFAALGLEVAITEADFRITLPLDANKLSLQAARYGNLMKIFLANRPAAVTFLTWGITDKYSWVPSFFTGTGAALPFDELYQPKPAFYALLNAMNNAPASIHGEGRKDLLPGVRAQGSGLKNGKNRSYDLTGRNPKAKAKGETAASSAVMVEKKGISTYVK